MPGKRRLSPPAGRAAWLAAAVLAVAVFLAYQPCWQGGFLWDDDAHVTAPALRSWQGLWRIWSDVGATVQYYPLLHTAFWLEHRLWGDAVLGYHLLNVALHCLAAFLAWAVLRRLKVPGAPLAAAVFALHPVHVESVAWIAEQKNTLSAVFYLAAMLAYLRFDRSRKVPAYLGAFGLFVLALLTKTVTATLPGALLVVFWWQRGRLSWRRDVLPLVPFLLVGAGMGLITTWWELEHNRCVGPEFHMTWMQRSLLAGRAVWFHAGKLFWPEPLIFIYPRWRLDPAAAWQYAFPLAAVALLAALWALRRRTRGPLAAALFFGGTLFPTLGFFNLYTFRYTYVANHYQYLASLAGDQAGASRRWRSRVSWVLRDGGGAGGGPSGAGGARAGLTGGGRGTKERFAPPMGASRVSAGPWRDPVVRAPASSGDSPAMYAIVNINGIQTRVEPETVIQVARLTGEPGAKLTFDQVLLVADGDSIAVGQPYVAGREPDGRGRRALPRPQDPHLQVQAPAGLPEAARLPRRPHAPARDRHPALGRRHGTQERPVLVPEQPRVERAAPRREALRRRARPVRRHHRAAARHQVLPGPERGHRQGPHPVRHDRRSRQVRPPQGARPAAERKPPRTYRCRAARPGLEPAPGGVRAGARRRGVLVCRPVRSMDLTAPRRPGCDYPATACRFAVRRLSPGAHA